MQSITVIGAGEMGHGIAELAAVSGFNVTLVDKEEDYLEEGYEKIEWSVEKLHDDGDIHEGPDKILDRISTTTNFESAVRETDAVIEAVPENLELKQGIFSTLAEEASDDTLLATNTSGIPISDIAEATDAPDRVIGMHFFNPVMLMDLIEIVRGEKTDDDTTEKAVELADAFDRESVVVRKDIPGFITSRTILPYMLEAAWQLHEGAASMEEIDATGKFEAGFPMGPFELADQTGIDVPVKGVDKGAFEEEYFEIAPNQREKVEAGHHGKKSGIGWHDWEDGDGCTASPDDVGNFDPIHVVAPTVNEAARLIEWDVASPDEIDLAMRLGTAYPKGPCRLGDELGLDTVLEALEDNPRHKPVDLLREMVADGKTGADAGDGFYSYEGDEEHHEFHLLEYDHDNESGITTITLDRPERQNTLNRDMFDELATAFDRAAEQRPRCLVVRGNGTFSAGADVSMLADLDQYEFFATPMGEVFTQLEELPFLTIAAIDGHCLGGGLELALACDFRVASESSEFGAPEVTLGLLPGGGGTQRLVRLVGLAKAKELVLLGDTISAAEAADCDLVTRCVPDDEFETAVDDLSQQVASGAPLAQHAAKIALHEGSDAPINSGLTLEKAMTALMLETDDLSEGIQSVYGDSDPKFTGS